MRSIQTPTSFTALEALRNSSSAVSSRQNPTRNNQSDCPRDPQVGLRHVTLGDAEVGLGHLEAAIDEYQKAVDVGYHNRIVNLPRVYALQGKMDEAKSVLAEALRANPKLNVKMLTERFAIPPALGEGLRKAGLRNSKSTSAAKLSSHTATQSAMSAGRRLSTGRNAQIAVIGGQRGERIK